jgi:hypothetical protein
VLFAGGWASLAFLAASIPAGAVSWEGQASAIPPTVSALALTTPSVGIPPTTTPVLSTPAATVPSVTVPSPSTPPTAPESLPTVPTLPQAPTPPIAGGGGSSGAAGGSSGASASSRSSGARAAPAGAIGRVRGPTAQRRVSTARRSPAATRSRRALGGVLAGQPAPAPASPGVRRLGLARSHAPSPAGGRPSGGVLSKIGRQLPLPLPVPDWSKPIILALLLLAIWLGVRSRLAGRRAAGLERQRTTLLHDLDVMQAALVPEVPPKVEGLAVSVAYRAADGPAAGGDFYDVFIPAPGKVAIVLGDVAGHGHEALTDAALTRYTLRAYLQAGLEPRAALALAGQVLVDPGNRFVTVVVALHDADSGTLTYASAGHPAPIFLGLTEGQPGALCSSAALRLGLPTGCRQTTISLPLGAEACFFSDGLIEARVGQGLLGAQRLREILEQLWPRRSAEELLAGVRAASRKCPDDMATCIVRATSGPTGALVHIEELEADRDALAGDRARGFLQGCGLAATAVEQAIERGSQMAEVHGTAVLQVQLRPTGPILSVSRPAPHTGQEQIVLPSAAADALTRG